MSAEREDAPVSLTELRRIVAELQEGLAAQMEVVSALAAGEDAGCLDHVLDFPARMQLFRCLRLYRKHANRLVRPLEGMGEAVRLDLATGGGSSEEGHGDSSSAD